MAAEIESNILIGPVELKPHPGNDDLEGGPGAYTSAVTRATSLRAARHGLSSTLLEAVQRAPHAGGVFWDTFYVYESEDDE